MKPVNRGTDPATEAQLQAARDLIAAGDHDGARAILRTLRGNPTAMQLMAKMDSLIASAATETPPVSANRRLLSPRLALAGTIVALLLISIGIGAAVVAERERREAQERRTQISDYCSDTILGSERDLDDYLVQNQMPVDHCRNVWTCSYDFAGRPDDIAACIDNKDAEDEVLYREMAEGACSGMHERNSAEWEDCAAHLWGR